MARVLFVFSIVCLISIISVSAVDITGPTVITSPGVYYLQNDILDNLTTKVIDIQSSDVVFDGMGRLIDGVSGADTYGIHVGNYDRVTVRNVRVQDFQEGLKYYSTSQSSIQNSTFRNNTWGAQLYRCDNIEVSSNNIVENLGYGVNINIESGDTISFVSNNISSNGDNGLYFSGANSGISRQLSILSNIISDNGQYGLEFANIGDANIVQNTFSNNYKTAIQIINGNNILITQNSILDNLMAGVYFYGVQNSQIVNNIITGQSGYGIEFKYYVYSNTINNNTVTDNNSGLHLQASNTDQNTITNNTFSNNANYGVFILNTGTNTFNNNYISNNTNTGFKLSGSSSNTITNCNISGNNINGVEFISGSNSNTFRDNSITNNNENGIYLSGSNSNTLNRNTISGNILKGIFAYQSQNNIITNNQFNNANNADLSTVMYANSWNTTNSTGPNIVNGPFLGGNYWANPSGTGFSQTCTDTNGNGFCDSSYSLATDNTDGLPLHAQTVTHTILSTAGVGGSISPSGSITVADGGTQTFTIIANSGYQILDVQVDSSSIGAVSTRTFSNVVTDHTIHATFTPVIPTSHIINATAGSGGFIIPNGTVSVSHGGNQAFAMTPNSGYTIQDVQVDSNSVGAISTYPFTNVVADHTIHTTFVQTQPTFHTITASSGTGGTIFPSGAVSVADGGSQTFSITPDTNFEVESVIVDGQTKGSLRSYIFNNVIANHLISANFVRIPGTYTINGTSDPWTILYPSGTKTYLEGANKTYLTQARPGSDLTKIIVDNYTYPPQIGGNWTFTNITADHNISTSGQPTPGQVHVLFDISPNYGPAPLEVTFTNRSYGDPTSFFWQFGDGKNSTNKDTVHTYQIPGVYTVTLRATNSQSGGVAVWNKAVTVTDGVIPQPTPTPVPGAISAGFTANPVSGIVPLNVQFQDQSSGNPVLWTWDFGDNQVSTLQNPLHQYANAGNYSVTLLAQNKLYSGSLIKPGYIVIN